MLLDCTKCRKILYPGTTYMQPKSKLTAKLFPGSDTIRMCKNCFVSGIATSFFWWLSDICGDLDKVEN